MTDATIHTDVAHHANTTIHVINAAGGSVFIGALWAHMPTLALYTAAVGAIWYTLLAIRLVIQSYKDVRDWWSKK